MIISCSEDGRQDFELVIPFAIHRQEHVSLGSEESPIPIVDAGVHCYVPKGLVRLGGDDYALNGLTGNKYHIDGFVMKKHPVTNREYIAFLNDLYHNGRREESFSNMLQRKGIKIAMKQCTGPKKVVFYHHRIQILWFMVGTGLYATSIGIVPMPMPNGCPKKRSFWRLPDDLEWEKQHAVPTKDFTLGAIALILPFAALKTVKKKKSPVPVDEFL